MLGQRLAAIVSSLTDCLCEMAEKQGAGPLCFCGYIAGESVAWDYCGSCDRGRCGMGYVQVNSVFPFTTFPNADEGLTCAASFAATLTVGVLRCFPMPDESGELPDAEAQADAAIGSYLDMAAVLAAIRCCDLPEYVLGSWGPQGPEGGCAGGEWTLTVALDG